MDHGLKCKTLKDFKKNRRKYLRTTARKKVLKTDIKSIIQKKKTKNFWSVKNLVKWRKISYRLEENTCRAGERIYIRIYKAFLKLNNKETITIKLENGSRKWTYISLKMICRWQISISTSLATREMQIKTTMRYHYILLDWQNQKISDGIKCWYYIW